MWTFVMNEAPYNWSWDNGSIHSLAVVSEVANQIKHFLSLLSGDGALLVGVFQFQLKCLYPGILIWFAVSQARQDADQIFNLLFLGDQITGQLLQGGLEDVRRIRHGLILWGRCVVWLLSVLAIGSSIGSSSWVGRVGRVRVHVRLVLDGGICVARANVVERCEHLSHELLGCVSEMVDKGDCIEPHTSS